MSGIDAFPKAIVAGNSLGRRYIVKFFEEGSYLNDDRTRVAGISLRRRVLRSLEIT